MALSGAVLAAGAAERFGAPKLLLPAGAGETVLSRAVQLMAQAVDGTVLVVLPQEGLLHREALKGLLPGRLALFENARSREGLGTSVAAAAGALGGEAEGLLLMPADIPYVSLALLRRLVARFRAERPWAVATSAQNRPQTPSIFSRSAIGQLAHAHGQRGAQSLLSAPPGPLALEPADPDELLDLDTWDAYQSAALALGWTGEEPPAVAWQDTPFQTSASDRTWALGPLVSASFCPAPEATKVAARRTREGLELRAAGGAAAALRVLRAAALVALSQGTR